MSVVVRYRREFKGIDHEGNLSSFVLNARQAKRCARISELHRLAMAGDADAVKRLKRYGDVVKVTDVNGRVIEIENRVVDMKVAFRNLRPEDKEEYWR